MLLTALTALPLLLYSSPNFSTIPEGVNLGFWLSTFNILSCFGVKTTSTLTSTSLGEIISAEFATLGIEGGEKEVILTEQQMPSHHHDGDTDIEPEHKHETHFPEFPNGGSGGPGYDGGNNQYVPNIWRETTPKGEHGHYFTTNNSGGDQAHNNMSPYRTIYYIEPIN